MDNIQFKQDFLAKSDVRLHEMISEFDEVFENKETEHIVSDLLLAHKKVHDLSSEIESQQ